MTEVVPVTVIVPTLGRAPLLRDCLESLAACAPAPAELLLMDQSGTGAAERAVAGLGLPVRVIALAERGISGAMNAGLAEAAHDTVLVTHDDCRVREDWIGAAYEAHRRHPEEAISGRVLPQGSHPVPSTRTAETAEVYEGEPRCNVMLPMCLVASAQALREVGGYDTRFRVAGEDSDLCYRWLMDGRRVRFDPSLVVWHRDWRDYDDLRRTYRGYWRAHGEVHGKHLRVGDTRLLPTMRRELRWVVIGTLRRLVHGRFRSAYPPDATYAGLTQMPRGLLAALLAPPAPPNLRARR